MSRPIQPTPVLRGNNARRVIEELENPVYSEVKQKFLENCKILYYLTKRK